MPVWLNLANLLTFSRLLFTPFIIAAIVRGEHRMALALFFIAAWTDVLDGWAARGLGARTAAGAYFDPIVDKCLMSGVFIALALSGTAPKWLVALVLGRDLYILTGGLLFLAFTSHRNFPPTIWGKLSTFIQIGTVVTWLTRNAFPAPWLQAAGEAVVWLCAPATAWSGLHYTWRGIRMARRPAPSLAEARHES